MINTIVFHIGNNYELYSMAEENDYTFIKSYFQIDDDNIRDNIIEAWNSTRD
jgi:hypothetical protein